MEDHLKLRATKDIVEAILAKHKGNNYFQCGNCDSIKSDAKELARTLFAIAQASIDSKGDFLEEIGEQCNGLLHQIIVIGMPEKCYEDNNFCTKWFAQNEECLLSELKSHWDDTVYISSRDVVLKIGDECESCKNAL